MDEIMNNAAKPPNEMLFKVIVGLILVITGGLMLTFGDRFVIFSLTLEGVGVALFIPALKRWRGVRPVVTMDQKKKRLFVLVVLVLTISYLACPFVLHWCNPKQSFKLLVLISAVCWPLSIALVWYVFIILTSPRGAPEPRATGMEETLRQAHGDNQSPTPSARPGNPARPGSERGASGASFGR